jgi:hypothetical protein
MSQDIALHERMPGIKPADGFSISKANDVFPSFPSSRVFQQIAMLCRTTCAAPKPPTACSGRRGATL